MNSDSKAALMGLASHSYTSNVAWDFHATLKTLTYSAQQSNTAVGVRGHIDTWRYKGMGS